MGIEVASSFTRKSNQPLDDGFIRADNTARDAIVSGVRYEGMLVYVTSTKKMWQLQGGITNSDWKEAGGSPLTTKGDIYVHDGTTNQRVAVGVNDYLLTADSAAPTGIAWKPAPVSLPSQTGNAGKILETDGTNASWADKPKTVVSATQTIANGGTIARTGGRVERVKVQASAGTRATVTIGNTPAPLDGDQLFIQGMSNTAPIVVGPFEDLVAGQIGHLMYDLATTTWVKVGGV